jgi:Zn-dependent M28 family amino/carboxypeptidase
MRRRFTLLVAAVFAAVLAPTAATVPPIKDSSALRDAVTVDGIREHQAAFQAIADANNGTRAAGTSGFDASVDYVVERLEAAGYRPTVQEFEFAFFQQTGPSTFEQVSPNPTTYAEGADFALMDYSADTDGAVTGTLVPTSDVVVPIGSNPANTSSSGCEPEDFVPASSTETQLALVQRGTCTFEIKVANAVAAGYDGVVLFNEGQPGREDAFVGTLGNPALVPAIMVTYAIGAELYGLTQSGPVTVSVDTETISETRTSANVIAETRRGKDARTIVVGAHLDSVLEGPGINDNGSGSATVLEIAEAFSELKLGPKNTVRFIWFGAEENNLLGSEHYVSQLSPEGIARIALMLNFDMVGSPNFVRFVYDGDGDETGTAGPAGSDLIEDVFLNYFASQGLATEATAFDGRSDYGPFIAAGIPAGGLFTGAEGIKTAEQQAIFGGTAGEQFDPCYHEACDTFDNVSLEALDQMSDAAADAIYTFVSRNHPLGHPRAAAAKAAAAQVVQGAHASR